MRPQGIFVGVISHPVWLSLAQGEKACRDLGWSKPYFQGLDDPLPKRYALRCDEVVVVDCDDAAAIEWWESVTNLPTAVRKTPKGRHYIYRLPKQEVTRANLRPAHSVDIKTGCGSLIVWKDTGYRWLHEIEPAVFDVGWLPIKPPSDTEVDDYNQIPDGRGNTTLTSIGGFLRRQGFDEHLIASSLHGINKLAMQRDPMPAIEVETIAKSVMRYDTQPDLDIEIEVDAPPQRLSRLHNGADRRSRPPMVWNLEDIIPANGVGQVFGDTGKGKSFVTIDLALRVANGLPDWYGRKINTAGPVVYVFMEGVFDQQARIEAWLAAHPGTTDDNLYTLDEEAFNLASDDSVEMLREDIELVGVTPALLIIDTQALAILGVNENDNGEMGTVMSRLKRWSTIDDYPIIVVHHTGYDSTHGRGATAVKAALDFQIHVRTGELKVTKVKGARETEWMKFVLASSAHSVWAKPGHGGTEKGISQLILDELCRHPRALTKKQVLARLGDTGAVRKAFDDLAESDEIVSVESLRVEGSREVRRDLWMATWVEVDFSTLDEDRNG